MYGYFALSCFKAVPRWFPPSVITIAQILQMVVGVIVQISSMFIYFTEADGAWLMDPANLVAGACMYGIYLGLFAQFALNRFIFKKSKVA